MLGFGVFRPVPPIPLGRTHCLCAKGGSHPRILLSWTFGKFISFVFSYPLDMECLLTHSSGLFPLSSSLPLGWLSSSISCYLQSCNIHLLMFPGLSALRLVDTDIAPRQRQYRSRRPCIICFTFPLSTHSFLNTSLPAPGRGNHPKSRIGKWNTLSSGTLASSKGWLRHSTPDRETDELTLPFSHSLERHLLTASSF